MFNSPIGNKIKSYVEQLTKDIKTIRKLYKNVKFAQFSDVKSSNLDDTTYSGISNQLYNQISKKLSLTKKGTFKNTIYEWLPYLRYGSINLNSPFKEIGYFSSLTPNKIYIDFGGRLYKIDVRGQDIGPYTIYEEEGEEWVKSSEEGSLNTLKDDLGLENKEYIEQVIRLLLIIIKIKKTSTPTDQIIIAKTLTDSILEKKNRSNSIEFDIIKEENIKRFKEKTNGLTKKTPIFIIEESNFVELLRLIKDNTSSDEKFKKDINDNIIKNPYKILLTNLIYGFFYKDKPENLFFIKQQIKLKILLKAVEKELKNIDKKKSKYIKKIISTEITIEIKKNSKKFDEIIRIENSNLRKAFKNEMIAELAGRKQRIKELLKNYNQIRIQVKKIELNARKTDNDKLFEMYKTQADNINYMRFDIYYEKVYYNKLINELRSKNIFSILGIFTPVHKLTFTIPSGIETIPKSIKLKKDIDIDMNNSSEIISGMNKYIPYVRKHGGLMDEYGIIDLTKLYRTGQLKKSTYDQFGMKEIHKLLYKRGYVLVQWNKKMLGDNTKWKILRYDYLFDNSNKNRFGKIDKEIIRDKINKLLSDRSFYNQHTENWISDHSIKKYIKKFCKETSTSYTKCSIVRSVQ